MKIINILKICCLSLLLFQNALSGDCWAKNYKIAIDIGHTPNVPGATSARGVPEYLFNKHIGDLLYQKLRRTRKFRGSFIINATGANISLAARAAVANKQRADLFISIHHDSVYPKDLSDWVYQGKILPHCDKFSGYSIFYSEKNGAPLDSLIFAVTLGSEMLQAGFHPTLHHAWRFTGGDKDLIDRTRGIYKYNKLVVLKKTEMPAVLFECGIIKSRTEEVKLCDHNYQYKLVATLFKAIEKYFYQ